MRYDGEALLVDILGGEERRCRAVPYLMSLDGGEENAASEKVEVRCRSLDGVVVGRLAVFDLPSDPSDSDDEEDEGAGKESNPTMEAYVETFSVVDRFFLGDAVRDVLACHRPAVGDAGAERGGAKDVAEQIWAVSHLFSPAPGANSEGAAGETKEEDGDDAPKPSTETPPASLGVEYGMVETLLSLIVQSTPSLSSLPSSSPLGSRLYLSRVLLELTKLRPASVPRAVVLAVSGLFGDFLPSLTPAARDGLGEWLAFHLVNTEFQWPKGYWDHWAPYVSGGGEKRSSRGEFVGYALRALAAMSSEGPAGVVADCLPPGSPLGRSVFLSGGEEGEVLPTLRDLAERMWNSTEDVDSLRQYVISDELAESYGSTAGAPPAGEGGEGDPMFRAGVWWRTALAVQSLFYPVVRNRERMRKQTEEALKAEASAEGAEGMEEDDEAKGDETEDLMADVADSITRFKPVVLAALARDADAYDSAAPGRVDDDRLLLAGEVSILSVAGSSLGGSGSDDDGVLLAAGLERLMDCGVVSGLAVATWSLGEHSSSSAGGAAVRPDWWRLCSSAVKNVLTGACEQADAARGGSDLGGGIGMIVDSSAGDGGGDPAEAAAARLEESLRAVAPMVKYAVERSCQILSGSNDEGRKISHGDADVAEGTKRLVSALLCHFRSVVLGDGTGATSGVLTMQNVLSGFASEDMDGEKLASACRSAAEACPGQRGRKLLEGVASSIERMM